MRVNSGLRWGVWGLLLAVGAGCGGRSRTDGGGQEPGGGASGVAGATSAGSSGASAASCPSAQPALGDRCNLEFGSTCGYTIDKCSSVSFVCIQGYWVQAPQLDGAAYDCNSFYPPNAPHDGDPCECLGKLDCSYDDCAARGQIHAVCDNATWHVKETACTKQVCGPNGLSCAPDTVCVIHVRGTTPSFECLNNPCLPGQTSCDCAAELCGMGQCTMDSGSVACEAPPP